jgi:hypothetical protein
MDVWGGLGDLLTVMVGPQLRSHAQAVGPVDVETVVADATDLGSHHGGARAGVSSREVLPAKQRPEEDQDTRVRPGSMVKKGQKKNE